MKKMISLFIGIFLVSCVQQQGVNFLEGNLDTALSRAQSQNKMIIVDFWSDG